MAGSMTRFQESFWPLGSCLLLLYMFLSVVELYLFWLGLNKIGCTNVSINENPSTLKFRYPRYRIYLTINHWQGYKS